MRRHLFCVQLFYCIVISILLLEISTEQLTAQPAPTDPVCSDFIENLQLSIEKCNDINNNWACYGNFAAAIEPSELRFDILGDRHPMSKVQSLKTSNKTGVIMMYLNERGDSDPVVVMAYGDVVLKPLAPHELNLSLTNTTLHCGHIGGMFVHTEEGKQGRVKVNGVEIRLGSTVFISLRNDGETFFVNVEGQVELIVPNLPQPITLQPGEALRVERDGTGQPTGVINGPAPVAELDLPYNLEIAREIINPDRGIDTVHNSNRSVDITAPLTRLPPSGLPPITSTLPFSRTLWDRESAACGGRIAIGDLVLSELHESGQECLYTFCGDAGDSVSLVMLAESRTTLDPWFDIRGPDNKFWKYHNDTSETDRNSLICNRALPTTGCYTIVTRAVQNNSQGRFTLALSGAGQCQQPEPQCQVMPQQGVNVRQEPDINAAVEIALVPGSRMKPLGRSSDGQWLRVDAIDVGRRGWVNVNRQHFICEISIIDLPVLVGPAFDTKDGQLQGAGAGVTPTSTPTPDECLGIQCEQMPKDDRPTPTEPPSDEPATSTPTPTPSKLDTPFGTS